MNLGGNFILDLSDPANPRKRGEIRYVKGESNYHGHGVCADGRYQYHGNYYRGIYIVDYEDPDNLKVVGELSPPQPKDAVRQLAVNDNYLYTTVTVAGRQNYETGNAGVAIFDVSDPANPKLLSKTKVPRGDMPPSEDVAHDSPPHKIQFFNDRKNLLINLGSKGFAVFDIGENPEKAIYLGLAAMDVVPRGTRPMTWNHSLWVIGDGPHFIDGSAEKRNPCLYLYKRVPSDRPAAKREWTIETFAGTGEQGHGGDGGPATGAQLDNPFGVIRGPDGAIWFTEYTGQRIRRIDADGTIRTMAGTGATGYTGDGGPASEATFNLPHEIRFDDSGNYYLTDMKNHAIRRVDAATGIITTFAGTGEAGYSGDGGAASKATLKQPHSIAFDSNGDLYICDIGNHVIRKVDMKTGRISTFAGTGKAGPTPHGAPIAGTPINAPRSMDFDAAGDLWLCTRQGNQVFRFDMRKGTIHHVAGTGEKGFTGNGGPAREATLSGPKGIAIDAGGNAWLADTESHSVRMIDAKTGSLELIAGTGKAGDGPDGDPLKCKLDRLHGIFIDADGSVFIGDSQAHRLRVLRKK
jgi:streptogramin lyase